MTMSEIAMYGAASGKTWSEQCYWIDVLSGHMWVGRSSKGPWCIDFSCTELARVLAMSAPGVKAGWL